MFAKFSPDCNKAAYVYKQNIYAEEIESGKVTQLTSDGAGNIIDGTFDWVYEEELDCRDGFRWSPDSRNIAYWQINTEGTGTFYMIDNLDSIYPKDHPSPLSQGGHKESNGKDRGCACRGWPDSLDEDRWRSSRLLSSANGLCFLTG